MSSARRPLLTQDNPEGKLQCGFGKGLFRGLSLPKATGRPALSLASPLGVPPAVRARSSLQKAPLLPGLGSFRSSPVPVVELVACSPPSPLGTPGCVPAPAPAGSRPPCRGTSRRQMTPGVLHHAASHGKKIGVVRLKDKVQAALLRNFWARAVQSDLVDSCDLASRPVGLILDAFKGKAAATLRGHKAGWRKWREFCLDSRLHLVTPKG